MAALSLTVLIILSLGLGVLGAFPGTSLRLGIGDRVLMAYPVGLATLATLSVVTTPLGSIGYIAVPALSLVALPLGLYRLRGASASPPGPSHTARTWLIAACAVVALAIVAVTAYLSATLPETGYDALGVWTARARMIAHHDGDVSAAWQEYLRVFGDRDRFPAEWPLYPPGWPFVMSLVIALSNDLFDPLSNALNVFNWLVLGAMIVSLAWRRVGSLAVIAGPLFALAPLFHQQAFGGYAELPMIVLLFGGFWLYSETTGTTRYVLPAIVLASAAFVKGEGLYLAAPVVAILLFDAWRQRRWLGVGCVCALMATAPLLLAGFDATVDHGLEVAAFDLSVDGLPSRFVRSLAYTSRALFLEDNFGIVPHLAVLLPLSLAPLSLDRRGVLAVTIVVLYAFEIAAMGALSPQRVFLYFERRTVVERLCMNLLPYLCFLATVFLALVIARWRSEPRLRRGRDRSARG